MSTQEKIIRYGVAGLGRAGWDMHVHSLRDRKDARIVAVADREAGRRDQGIRELGARAYQTVEELLQDEQVDVVVLATPSIGHAQETMAAFAAEKHVVVEKPMAMTVAEADSMIAAAKKAGKELFVHHNLRFSGQFTHLEEVIRSGRLGKLFQLRFNNQSYVRRNDWQSLRKNGGGLLNNSGSHSLDLVLALLPTAAVKVLGDLKQICAAGDTEDHVKIFLKCADGCTVDMDVSTAQMIDPKLPKWILCGANGTLTSDGNQSDIRWYAPKAAPPLQLHDGPAADRKYGNDEQLPWQHEIMPSVGPDVGTFYDNVSGHLLNGQSKRVTPESVREVIRVIAAVRQSSAHGGVVDLT